MDRPFSMYTIISMYKGILSYIRATHNSWMEKKPDGHLLKVVCLFLYLESNQVIILWKD